MSCGHERLEFPPSLDAGQGMWVQQEEGQGLNNVGTKREGNQSPCPIFDKIMWILLQNAIIIGVFFLM